MTRIDRLVREMEQEAQTTRKMLSRIPDDMYDWQPHPRSMPMRHLAAHIAELPSWVSMGLTTDGLDFATTPYVPTEVTNTAGVLASFEQWLTTGLTVLRRATDADLEPIWTLRNGDAVYFQGSKGDIIRHAFSQTVHHRAQLGVYLRLLDIPIPGSYGPSADEPM